MAGSPMYPGAQAQNGIPVSNTTWHTVLVTLQTSRSHGSISEKNYTGTRDMYDTYYYLYRATKKLSTHQLHIFHICMNRLHYWMMQ